MMKIYTKDGRAELVAENTSRVIAQTEHALLYESCTAHSARLFARQFCVDHHGATLGRFLTLADAQHVYDDAVYEDVYASARTNESDTATARKLTGQELENEIVAGIVMNAAVYADAAHVDIDGYRKYLASHYGFESFAALLANLEDMS